MEQKFYLISPDNIPTTLEALTFAELADEFSAFFKRYIHQGYYSSPTFGRIPLPEILDYVRIVPANEEGGCFESL